MSLNEIPKHFSAETRSLIEAAPETCSLRQRSLEQKPKGVLAR
jgi:hypothetical protein